jgi:hypothetical protein
LRKSGSTMWDSAERTASGKTVVGIENPRRLAGNSQLNTAGRRPGAECQTPANAGKLRACRHLAGDDKARLSL